MAIQPIYTRQGRLPRQMIFLAVNSCKPSLLGSSLPEIHRQKNCFARNAALAIGIASDAYPWTTCNVSGQTAHAKGWTRGVPELQVGGHVTISVSGTPP